MTKARTHYSGRPDRGRPVWWGHGPPGRRQQQPWASPSLQTATQAMVTRTESSEPVRQQLVRVSLEATHCSLGCTPCLDLGSEGAACAPAGLAWSQGCPDPLHSCCVPLAVIGHHWPGAIYGDTASGFLGGFPMQGLMVCGTRQGKCLQMDHL